MLQLRWNLCLLIALSGLVVDADDTLLVEPISIRLMHGEEAITCRASAPITFDPEGAEVKLSPGVFTTPGGVITEPLQTIPAPGS